jgi:hypothetical protein
MDINQIDEEQLYYEEKYLKYKLKYLVLKQQHGGFLSQQTKENIKNRLAILGQQAKTAGTKFVNKASEIASKTATNLKEKYNFEPQKIKDYLQTQFNSKTNEEKEIHSLILSKNIFDKIKQFVSSKNIQDTIDDVLNREFKGDERLEILKNYVRESIDSYNKQKQSNV